MINHFVIIVNLLNRFDKGLTKIFLFRRALLQTAETLSFSMRLLYGFEFETLGLEHVKLKSANGPHIGSIDN